MKSKNGKPSGFNMRPWLAAALAALALGAQAAPPVPLAIAGAQVQSTATTWKAAGDGQWSRADGPVRLSLQLWSEKARGDGSEMSFFRLAEAGKEDELRADPRPPTSLHFNTSMQDGTPCLQYDARRAGLSGAGELEWLLGLVCRHPTDPGRWIHAEQRMQAPAKHDLSTAFDEARTLLRSLSYPATR
ncbi:hypothetical protein [Pelomonas sp. SE-A7]|uniref:hypothetical protein n=1 Tax=Pelomonas sp. SE-A7 TaxID=3054953 RepID=UPI00259CA661|nr:hypothetical protein [Pelomonas sp. SE-A7]MDM4767117.1 hypothetical protein [Pelomonas sp. SE-A7]